MSVLSLPLTGCGLGAGGPLRPRLPLWTARSLARWRLGAAVLRERRLGSQLRRAPSARVPGTTCPVPSRAFAGLVMRVLGGRCGALLACLALVFPVSEANCE